MKKDKLQNTDRDKGKIDFMISADIPMTLTSTADFSLPLNDFIEYSIKNDLNIVTAKWLAHTKKLTVTEAKKILNSFWESIGKSKTYSAIFSVLSQSETDGLLMELIDHDKLDLIKTKVISMEIYSIQAIPLKDKSVQLGMINVPIYDLAGEIEAPWINSENFPEIKTHDVAMKKESTEEPKQLNDRYELNEPKQADELYELDELNEISGISDHLPPPEKKMKMVKTTRTFMQNGYQMTETINELVPCEENSVEIVTEPSVKAVVAPPVKAKQSSMMSFFKKK